MIAFNAGEIRNQLINNGIGVSGALKIEDDFQAVFFLDIIGGTSITIKDNDGNTIYTIASAEKLIEPIRSDYGFDIAGTNLNFRYSRVTVMKDADNIGPHTMP